MRVTKEVKELVGNKLARLYYLQGHTKQEAVLACFPRYSQASARKNAPLIWKRYDVMRRGLDMFSSVIKNDDVEKLINILLDRAMDKDDDQMLLN